MPTELDLELVPEIQAVLDELGMPTTLTRRVATINTTTGGVGSLPAAETQTIKATPPEPAKQSYWKTDTVTTTFLQTLIAAQDLLWPPANGYTLTLGSSKHLIEEVRPIYSGELICAYMLLLVI